MANLIGRASCERFHRPTAISTINNQLKFNMKHHLLVSILLLISLGCSRDIQAPWQPDLDGGHLIASNDASIFAFTYNDDPEHSIVFYFPYAIGSSSAHDFNPVSHTFNYSGTIKNDTIENDVLKYEVSSVNPTTMTCNNVQYDLGDGTVFHVDADGRLSQLPYVGLKPTKNYVNTLRQYFATNAKQPKAQ